MGLKLKKNHFGNILRDKARSVAPGYKQEKSLNYLEKFTAVVKLISYKCFFAVEIKRRYQIRHMNVVTAFFYEFLDEVIYIKQPYLFATELDKVCKLIKALNKLKQALHVWYRPLLNF